jgi:hypothetical protein
MAYKGRHTSAIQNELLLTSLTRFFSKAAHYNILASIISGKSLISLRLIDWFVTNYCKKHAIVIVKPTKAGDDFINVYLNYRSQLRAFSKHLFDPFRRQDKIMFKETQTTIGQLNFFKWAIENEILVYIQGHQGAIVAEMNAAQDKAGATGPTSRPSSPGRSSSRPSSPGASKTQKPKSESIKTSKPGEKLVVNQVKRRLIRFD